jgi:uncharacterized membrane-anchored protein YitT (DUF2179 family)
MAKAKIPWLAAVLNILLAGLGYLYIGKRKTFGILLIIAEVFNFVWIFTNPAVLAMFRNIWITVAGVLYTLAFAIDAYLLAKEA